MSRDAVPARMPLSLDRWLPEARVLAVEDDPAAARLLARTLAREGYRQVAVEEDPLAAVRRFDEVRPDLVLLDLHMPGRDGFVLLEELRARSGHDAYLPILVMTGDPREEVRQRALVMGASDFLSKPFRGGEVVYRLRNLLRGRYQYLQVEAQKRGLEEEVRRRIAEVEDAHLEVLQRLAVASAYRDDETGAHTRRVGELAERIARTLGLSPSQAALIGRAAQLHDLGKIGVPDLILLRPDRLRAEEFEVMKAHTTIGAQILAGGRSELIMLAEQIARCHHERWDGAGYPAGLRGDAIPLAARIVAVADFFDALTHDRRYRDAVPEGEVTAQIRAAAGSHFDPEVVSAFLLVHSPAAPTSAAAGAAA